MTHWALCKTIWENKAYNLIDHSKLPDSIATPFAVFIAIVDFPLAFFLLIGLNIQLIREVCTKRCF